MFPTAKRLRHRLQWWDVGFAILVGRRLIAYMVWQGDSFTDRNINPTHLGPGLRRVR